MGRDTRLGGLLWFPIWQLLCIANIPVSTEIALLGIGCPMDDPRDFAFTVKPEEFCITHLVNDFTTNSPQLSRFKCELIKGHFATGGDVVAGDAIFQVDEVIYFRELTTTDQASANPEYLLLGSVDEQLYLTHLIAGQPNFDHVVSDDVEGFPVTGWLRTVALASIFTTICRSRS